jgi:ceramide glucosyltransferase
MTAHLLDLIAPAFLVLAVAGSLYTLAAVFLLRRFAARRPAEAVHFPGVTLLKPLHGPEAGLHDSLASFCRQDYPGPVQIVFGVREVDDPAAGVVQGLRAEFPDADLELVVDATVHGPNGKISNLVNMARVIRHEVVVIADSDIRVERDYLRHLMGALEQPGVGLVTCLYRGVPAGGLWSRLGAMAINHHFLPSVLVGLGIGRADPCFGATMALRRETLAEIGGFEAFVNHLADDHAIGEAVRRTGAKLSVPPMITSHICRERNAGEMLRQELRWARTLRLIDPAGFFGSVVTHPLPLALLGLALSPSHPWGWAVLALALGSRLLLEVQTDRVIGTAWAAWPLGPVRDLLSFVVFVASHFTDAVTWRGQRFRVRPDGTLISAKNLAR